MSLTSLPFEIIGRIFDYLELPDLVDCSLTCRPLHWFFNFHQYGLFRPLWHNVPCQIPNNGVSDLRLYYRNAVMIDATLYIVVLSLNSPTCWQLRTNEKNLEWLCIPVKVFGQYRPVKYPATSSISNQIYIHGGIDLVTGQPTNALYELSVNNMHLRTLSQSNVLPRPRSMHTLNAIDRNRFMIYGGQCFTNDRPYDCRDYAIYDITNKSWTIYNPVPNIPYARSLHLTVLVRNALYIYGGQQITYVGLSEIHNDDGIWAYDTQNNQWRKYLSPNIEQSTSFRLPSEWISTTGRKQSPGRRVGAAMVCFRNKIVIFGGSTTDNWERSQVEKPWEYMKIFSASKRTWEHIRIRGLPRMQCVAFTSGRREFFVIGENANTGEIMMGRIFD
ncbi:8840_t:CDS:2 [Paraglomus brasilianum]|uniref:8840_t:CDS:1 n=1 Tax=Paraglomus brasilianum TaxID=144538 RepID=A0A9N8ZE47_9GLOM|nr:8840_t:CDS:2 [Paraglomus brasilianum]